MSDANSNAFYNYSLLKLREQPFHFICKPVSYRCNLNCSYCFYLPKSSIYGDKVTIMEDKTLKLFTRLYISRQPLSASEVNFVWQGGEPTLAGIDFFRRAVKYQKLFARPNMKITNSFQTNGVLIDEKWAEFFKENDFLVGISIDGDEAIHNLYRTFPSGEGSFKYVMRAIEILKNYQVDFNTLTTVSSSNATASKTIYNFFKSIGSTFMQFIPIVEPQIDDSNTRGISPLLSNVNKASLRSVSAKEWGVFLVEIFNIWKEGDIGEIFVQLFDNVLNLVYGYPAAICNLRSTCGRAMVIEHNGDIYPCDHFVFEETKLGNIHKKDLDLIINSEKQLRFGIDKQLKMAKKCKLCPWNNLCFCECPANRIIPQSEGEKLNALCEGYDYFFKNTIQYFEAMARAIRNGKDACDYKDFI